MNGNWVNPVPMVLTWIFTVSMFIFVVAMLATVVRNAFSGRAGDE